MSAWTVMDCYVCGQRVVVSANMVGTNRVDGDLLHTYVNNLFRDYTFYRKVVNSLELLLTCGFDYVMVATGNLGCWDTNFECVNGYTKLVVAMRKVVSANKVGPKNKVGGDLRWTYDNNLYRISSSFFFVAE